MIGGMAQGFVQKPVMWSEAGLYLPQYPNLWESAPAHSPKWAHEGWETRRSRAKARRRGECR